MHSALRIFGNLRVSLMLILSQMAIFYGIITSDSFNVIAVLFILGIATTSLIAFTIDIFLQRRTDVGHTGSIRGIYMTVINAAWICGPLLGGILVAGNNYRNVYIASFALLFPLLYLVYENFRTFKDAHYVKLSTRQTFIKILRDRNISKIFGVNIILQTFFAWMTVYTPIYLHQTLGFSWSEVSVIFTIMLIPFILVEIPLGKLADKKWGEKEIMAMGFTIMGLSTIALSFFDMKSVLIWAIALFITRIGAASAEIMIETYFFKKMDGRDPEVLSMFRITRPLSYFTAPILTTIGLAYTTDRYLFVFLGILCLLALYPVLTIKDTR